MTFYDRRRTRRVATALVASAIVTAGVLAPMSSAHAVSPTIVNPDSAIIVASPGTGSGAQSVQRVATNGAISTLVGAASLASQSTTITPGLAQDAQGNVYLTTAPRW